MSECGYKKCNRHQDIYEAGEVTKHYSDNFCKDTDFDTEKRTNFLRCLMCDWECERIRGVDHWSLASHHAHTHITGQVYECSLCSKKFYSLAFLEDHIEKAGTYRICC